MDQTAQVRAANAQARNALRGVVAEARGSGPIAVAMMSAVGMALLGRIRAAFVVKARGGTDEAGDFWRPLSPRTVAYSRTRQRGRGGRTRTEKKRDVYPSQALNQKQQDRWWEVYRRQLRIYRGDKRHAAAVAWLVLKSEGAVTLVDKYGHRQVEILRDTGLLLNSLSPGVRSAEQILRTGPGEVVVGTNRRGARDHHEGRPPRLPQRRLWPSPDRWPSSWWDDILDPVRRGISDTVIDLLKRTS